MVVEFKVTQLINTLIQRQKKLQLQKKCFGKKRCREKTGFIQRTMVPCFDFRQTNSRHVFCENIISCQHIAVDLGL